MKKSLRKSFNILFWIAHCWELCLWYFQCVNLKPEELQQREVDFLDIAYDELPSKHYKESEVTILSLPTLYTQHINKD